MKLRLKKKRPLIRTSALLALVVAMFAIDGAGAVTIYRCGATGNSFSDRPCQHGHAFAAAADVRSDAERIEAARIAASERRLADELQRERLRLAAAAPRMAAGFNASPAQMSASLVSSDRRGRPARRGGARHPPFATDRPEFVAYAPAAGKLNRR